jgi:hypothetical protein
MFEDRPEKDTPDWLREELHEYGGEAPNGQSIWRMILAQNRRNHCFGTRNHIQKGTLATLGDNSRPTDLVPDRIEEGEHWIPRYKFHGWILERWFPASIWGTREKWEGEKAKDGRTRLLAAYPQRGDYMMMPCGPWKTIQEAGDLKGYIRHYNIQRHKDPANWDNHLRAMTAFEEKERQDAADRYAEEVAAQHRLGLGSILRSASRSAQEFRNIVSKHTAGGVNLGASESWG